MREELKNIDTQNCNIRDCVVSAVIELPNLSGMKRLLLTRLVQESLEEAGGRDVDLAANV